MEREIDLDNLTRADFEELARYAHALEEQVAELKATAITLATQRNNEHKKVKLLTEELNNRHNTIDVIPIQSKLETTINLVNPEQYREKKQF